MDTISGKRKSEFLISAGGSWVRFTSVRTSIGMVYVASTGRGIFSLTVGIREKKFRRLLDDRFGAQAIRDDAALGSVAEKIRAYLDGRRVEFDGPFDLRGTPFQVRVWRYLLTLPYGSVRSYGEVAEGIGLPAAFRAVGRACGANPVPLLVPCHRVVASDGGIGGYGLGFGLKRTLLRMEGVSVGE